MLHGHPLPSVGTCSNDRKTKAHLSLFAVRSHGPPSTERSRRVVRLKRELWAVQLAALKNNARRNGRVLM